MMCKKILPLQSEIYFTMNTDNPQQSYNEMQMVKRHFFALRNGIIADVLRKAGSPYRIIFGLTIPQLAEVAQATPHTRELAEKLWANTTTRESLLLAPMLMPREEFSCEDAEAWCREIACFEVADNLCHKLLRHQDYSSELALKLIGSEEEMQQYAGIRLAFNLCYTKPDLARKVADIGINSSYTSVEKVARQLIEELDFV